jgi:hypothetical protein
VAGTAWSLHVAANLADLPKTETFLTGVAGEDFAKKAAPTVLRMLKSSPTRYGAFGVAVMGTSIYLYEKVVGNLGNQMTDPDTYQLRMILNPDGSVQQAH